MLVFSNLIVIMVNRSGASGMIDRLRVKNVAVRLVITGSLTFLIMIFFFGDLRVICFVLG